MMVKKTYLVHGFSHPFCIQRHIARTSCSDTLDFLRKPVVCKPALKVIVRPRRCVQHKLLCRHIICHWVLRAVCALIQLIGNLIWNHRPVCIQAHVACTARRNIRHRNQMRRIRKPAVKYIPCPSGRCQTDCVCLERVLRGIGSIVRLAAQFIGDLVLCGRPFCIQYNIACCSLLDGSHLLTILSICIPALKIISRF